MPRTGKRMGDDPHGKQPAVTAASAVMGRLLVMWTEPMHLSRAEAESWVRLESRRLLEQDGVECLELARLAPASDANAQPFDWLLDVRLLAGSTAAACVEAPLFSDWLGDLRLLGMRPVVMLVGDATAVGRDRG
jgi:hypothetical protein